MIKVERKRTGAFYTPDHVAHTLVRWVVRREADRLFDPSCGDGQFLVNHPSASGVERDPSAAAIARERAPWADVRDADFFAWASTTRRRFDCVAGNPPFIRYQRFSGDVRRRALALCTQQGVKFSGLASSWAPFLVVAASLLEPGGRMAFVVPAEIGHAPYAAPAISYLASRFRRVQLIAIREKLFPQLSEDAWLLYADGFGAHTDHLVLTQHERFEASSVPPSEGTLVRLADWRKWRSRLRPFLLGEKVRETYTEVMESPASCLLGEVARVGIGYVTGANDFFHLRPSQVRASRIADRFLQPTVRNARSLPPRVLTRRTVEAWRDRDKPFLLLRLSAAKELPRAVQDYLKSPAGREAQKSYKCRNRNPWYVVPDVRIPDAFLTYMSGEAPALVANAGQCACTNSVHGVSLVDGVRLSHLQRDWEHPLTHLSCEIEGHPLGGGMLKLEPREAGRVVLCSSAVFLTRSQLRAVEEGTATMRRWRHYG